MASHDQLTQSQPAQDGLTQSSLAKPLVDKSLVRTPSLSGEAVDQSLARRKRRSFHDTHVLQRFAEVVTSDDIAKAARKEPSLAELIWPEKEDYASNILAGLISGLKVALGMVTFSNIIFNTCTRRECASINAQLTTGINMNFMAACITLVWSTFSSGMNALVAPQDTPSILLGLLSSKIARTVEDPATAGHTLIAAGFISTLLTGAFLLFLGRVEASYILRKLPTPVIGGFIAAMGMVGIRSSLSMITGVQFSIMWPEDLAPFHDWKVWAHLGLAFYSLFSIRYLGDIIKRHVHTKNTKAIVSPVCLVSPIIVFYVVMLCRGQVSTDIAWARSVGWMYPAFPSTPVYTLWENTLRLDLVDWSALSTVSVAGSIVVCALLTSLSAVLSIVGTAPCVPCASNPGGLGGRIDLDRELVALGSGQLIAGALTGVPGYQQTALSVNMYIFGGTHRLAQIVASGFIFAVGISGVPVASYTPKFFLGAVFLNLGISFVKTHIVDNFGVMDAPSYCSMLTIVAVGVCKDLTTAVVVGILFQTVLMTHQASTNDAVYQCGTFDGGFISARIRHMDQASRLRWTIRPGESGRGLIERPDALTGRLEVIRLMGPLFFGNAPTLEDDVDGLLRICGRLSHLVFDMSKVTQVDDTGVRCLNRILDTARAVKLAKFAIIAHTDMQDRLRRHMHTSSDANRAPVLEFFPNLEQALEQYEDELLGLDVEAGKQWLKPHGLSDEQWDTVKTFSSSTKELQKNEVLLSFGWKLDGIFILVVGELTLETKIAPKGVSGPSSPSADQRDMRISGKYVAPFPVSVSGFFTKAKYSAFHVCARDTGATLLKLSANDLSKLREENPDTYIALMENVIGYWAAVEAAQLRWRAALTS